MKFLLNFLILIPFSGTLMVACGPTTPPETKHDKPTPIELKVGSHFMTTPTNWVAFPSFAKGQIHTVILKYVAVGSGQLILSHSSFGYGRGCDTGDSKEEGDFRIEFVYHLKDLLSGQFLRVEPTKMVLDSSMDKIPMAPNQELLIEVSFVAHRSCSSAEVHLLAIFENQEK